MLGAQFSRDSVGLAMLTNEVGYNAQAFYLDNSEQVEETSNAIHESDSHGSRSVDRKPGAQRLSG
jgi:hypothetical protein